jgi:cytochrome o ubiquinol oxidase subunit 1
MDIRHLFLGNLTLDAFKHDWIEVGADIMMVVSALMLVGYLSYFKKWKWLWKEWLTSLDPKKIGVMYIIVAVIMLFKGLIDAAMMRAQQAFSVGDSQGYLGAEHFQQLFTAHGSTMIFFVGMPFVFGVLNLILPLQIGARDVAFPFLNSLSFWLFVAGGMFIMVSLMIGNYSGVGWVAYPPLSGIQYSPDEGVDYWIWSVQLAGLGSLFSGINFFVTIIKMRCPGMTLMKMPIFVWASLATMTLVMFAFPILTVTLVMLTLDRLMDMHFFTADFGGNPMMYVNLIWAWGHPEVYILILPAFGVFSETIPVFSEKKLFGYTSMVWAIAVITLLSFIVWLHHFFTMGASANINAFFGIMTMLIAIPTGVKIFNWVFTMFRGRVHFDTPIMWFLAFVFIFSTGGLTGILLSIAPVDFQVHNSLFLVAHFHSMVIGGVLFGFFSAITYWFPKFASFKLNETLGRCAFWCWFLGFVLAFMPLYILGLMGTTRRLNHYEAETGWQPLFLVALVGVSFIVLGFTFQILQLLVSIKQRNKFKDLTGDPWNGRTLEWATTSPPPFYNFASIPHVSTRDAFWEMKLADKRGGVKTPPCHDIIMPKDTGAGIIIAGFAFVFAFAVIWHMLIPALACFLAAVIGLIIRLSQDDIEHIIPAKEIEKIEAQRLTRK